MKQVEARLDAMLSALRSLKTALELREHWKDTMPDRLIEIANEAISDEERMREASGD